MRQTVEIDIHMFFESGNTEKLPIGYGEPSEMILRKGRIVAESQRILDEILH